MYASLKRKSNFTIDIWPGFVDALAALLIVMIFAFMVLSIAQLYLSDALQGSHQNLESLRSKVNEISRMLGLEKDNNIRLQNSLIMTSQQVEGLQNVKSELISNLEIAQQDIGIQKNLNLGAQTQISAFQQELVEFNKQLQTLNTALEISETDNLKQKLEIEGLGKKLNQALASKVQQLAKYRSEFFGRLKEVLENRSDVRVVGDRFVFQSEVLFPSASANIGKEGKNKLQKLAKTLQNISKKIPQEINWVLRVDGHTDELPIHNEKFASNWELSAARAISVVKFLIQEGIAAENLAVSGFGKYHPIEKGKSDKVRALNRRIEIKLDQH